MTRLSPLQVANKSPSPRPESPLVFAGPLLCSVSSRSSPEPPPTSNLCWWRVTAFNGCCCASCYLREFNCLFPQLHLKPPATCASMTPASRPFLRRPRWLSPRAASAWLRAARTVVPRFCRRGLGPPSSYRLVLHRAAAGATCEPPLPHLVLALSRPLRAAITALCSGLGLPPTALATTSNWLPSPPSASAATRHNLKSPASAGVPPLPSRRT